MNDRERLEGNLMRRMNIGDIPKRTAAKYHDRVVLVYGERRITFRELNENCCRMAHVFQVLGIKRGDRITFMTHYCLQYIYSWMGACKIGAAINPLNFMLMPLEREHIVNDAESRLFFAEDVLEDRAGGRLQAEGRGEVRHHPHDRPGYPAAGGMAGPGRALRLRARRLRAHGGDRRRHVPAPLHQRHRGPAQGGHEHPQELLHHLLSGTGDLNIAEDDAALLSIPLYHIAGKYLLLEFIDLGCKLVLEYAPNPIEILELTQSEKVTYWVYPPTLYQIMPSMPGFDAYDLSSLRKCVSFGAVMPVPILEQWKKLLPGSEWRNYYGQTESGPLGSTLQPEDFERKIDTIGTPHTGVEIKIFDDEDNEVPVGEMGEIVMRGPSVMKGYYNLEEKTAETLRGGWLHTGDLGKFDEEGFLYFLDRKKDMIKSGGENVASKEVEDAIIGHEKVMQVAVVGLPDDYWIEMVAAAVVPYPGVEVTEEEIIAYAKQHLAGYKVPKKVFVMSMEEMPVLPSGKILKRELRDRLSKQQ